jgi:hypothetical protein
MAKGTNTVTMTPEVRQLLVRQLGAALAEAWRRKHGADRDDGNQELEVSATDGARTSSAAGV